MSMASGAWSGDFLPPFEARIAEAVSAADELPADRQRLLRTAAEPIAMQLAEHNAADLIFICTANSRRSQLGQVWAKLAATHYGLDGIATYSGGTQATACNPRTVRTLRQAGFTVTESVGGENPRYLLQFSENQPALELYSKRYDDPANPQQNFVALMCCNDADEACPTVTGAIARVRLSYEDPKAADGTPQEDAVYDERSRQIAAEMFFLMKHVAAAQR
jgi:protein-tyrosine-phosphatase